VSARSSQRDGLVSKSVSGGVFPVRYLRVAQYELTVFAARYKKAKAFITNIII
jgi:hypothetical protein